MKYLKILIILLSSFFSGFYIGFKSNNKGYINGVKFSLIIISIFLLSSLSVKGFKFISIIYYLIIIIVITLGSMLGINRKSK